MTQSGVRSTGSPRQARRNRSRFGSLTTGPSYHRCASIVLAPGLDRCHHPRAMTLVFTYGPDTLQARMFDRVGPSDFLGTAVLEGFQLVFDKPNMKDKNEGL